MILSPHTWHHLCHQSHRALVLTLVFRTRWGVLWATLLSFFSLSFSFFSVVLGIELRALHTPQPNFLKIFTLLKPKKTDTHRIGLEHTIMGKHTYCVLSQRSFSLALPVWASRGVTPTICVYSKVHSPWEKQRHRLSQTHQAALPEVWHYWNGACQQRDETFSYQQQNLSTFEFLKRLEYLETE